MGPPSKLSAPNRSEISVSSNGLPPTSNPHTHRAIQRTVAMLTAHQNRWRWEVAELLERINQLAIPLELAQTPQSYAAIIQGALNQLDDDQFAQWVAAVWGEGEDDEGGDRFSPPDPSELEDWGTATLESQ